MLIYFKNVSMFSQSFPVRCPVNLAPCTTSVRSSAALFLYANHITSRVPKSPVCQQAQNLHTTQFTPKMAQDAPDNKSPLPKPAETNTISENPPGQEWKHRPPYLIQSPEEFGEIKWRGSCHCGQVTYQLKRERPLNAKFCHCRGCQVLHG